MMTEVRILSKKNYKVERNRDRISFLFMMLFIYPLNNLLNSIFEYKNITPPNIIIMLYILVILYGLYIIFKYSFTVNDMVTILYVYTAYIIIYMLSSDLGKIKMQSVYMNLMYFYFVPFSVLIISHIDDFSYIVSKRLIVLSDIIVLVTIISKVFLNDSTYYMDFSYNLLPFWGLILISAIYFKHKNQYLFLILSFIEAIVFGSRGALLSLLILLLFTSLMVILHRGKDGNIYKKIVFLPISIIILYEFMKRLVARLINSKFADKSYILLRLKIGNITESSARIDLLEKSIEEIKKMGLNINGLFYDITFLPNGMYTHNFIIETILSLGWVIGLIFIISIFRLIVKAYLNQSYFGRIIWLYFICVLFLKFFVSSSIFSDGKFIIFLAIMVSLRKFKQDSFLIKSHTKGRDD